MSAEASSEETLHRFVLPFLSFGPFLLLLDLTSALSRMIGFFRQDVMASRDSEGADQLGGPSGSAESSSGLERSQSLFGRSSEPFDDGSGFDFQSEMNFSALAASSHGCDADGYQDPEWELEEPQSAEQTARFATIIEDHCLSVPPVMTVKLP